MWRVFLFGGRRLSGVAVVATLSALIVVGGAAPRDPVHAQVSSYPDPTGDGTVPALDIVSYAGVHTSAVIGGSVRVQAYDGTVTGGARFSIQVDTTGDDTPEFRLERRPVDGSFWVYRGTGWDDIVCRAYVSPASSAGVEMLAPTNCLGNPASARFGFYLTSSLHGFDYAGFWTPWLAPTPGDPTWQPQPYTTPSPTSPTPTPTPSPTTTPSPGPTLLEATVPSRMRAPQVTVRGRRLVARWAPPAQGRPVLGYLVKLRPGKVRFVSGDRTRTVFKNLKLGTYRVRVAARNTAGTGAYSAWSRARIQ